MKRTKNDDTLLRSIEDHLEQYRKNELDGTVIAPAVFLVIDIRDLLPFRALPALQGGVEIAQA